MMQASYFDDNLLMDTQHTAHCTYNLFIRLLQYLGTPPKPAKTFAMASHHVFLGAAITVKREQQNQDIVITAKTEAKQHVLDDLDQAILQQHLSPGKAAKLRGRSGWLASNAHGRIGRLGLAALKRLQYDRMHMFDTADHEALIFHRQVVLRAPPRDVPLGVPPSHPLVLYTDAEYTQKELPGVGFLLFRRPPLVPLGFALKLPQQMLDEWLPRRTQILPAELAAVPLALAVVAEFVQDADVIAFCDNDAAVSTLVRGSSKTDDCARITEVVHALILRLRCRLWVDWVDSDSNPSDGLSRAGTADEWTRHRFHNLRTLSAEAIPSTRLDVFDWAEQLLHWGRHI